MTFASQGGKTKQPILREDVLLQRMSRTKKKQSDTFDAFAPEYGQDTWFAKHNSGATTRGDQVNTSLFIAAVRDVSLLSAVNPAHVLGSHSGCGSDMSRVSAWMSKCLSCTQWWSCIGRRQLMPVSTHHPCSLSFCD